MMPHRQHVRASFIAIDFDIVADPVSREQPHYASRIQGLLGAELIQQLIGIAEQALRLFAHHFIFQNARIFPGQRPGHKERRPVDIVTQGFDTGFHFLHAQAMGHRRRIAFPVKGQIVIARGFQRDRRGARLFTAVLNTYRFVLFAGSGDKIITLGRGQQRSDHADGTRGVLHVDRRAAVVLLDFHRRMRFRGSGAADQQRNSKALTLHLLRHVDHLIQRRRNQPGEANQVGVNLAGGFQDFIRRHHHAKVDDFVVVTLQHHADNILADVVNVTLHGGDDHLAVAGTFLFAGLNIGFEVGHRLLHHAGGFHHLRQEHFALAKQIANHVHPVHQRPFNHLDRTRGLLASFFSILLNKFGNAFHQRIFEALFHVPTAPFRHLGIGSVISFATAIFLSQLQQTLGAIVTTVEDHIFNRIAQLGGQVVVNRQLSGVDDPHVHAVANGVVKEYRVNGFTNRVVTTEGERHVGDAAGDQRVR